MNNFEGKSLSELKEILKSLRLYKDLSVKLWNRWKKLFKNIIWNTNNFKIEYFSEMNEDDALEQWLTALKKIFWDDIKKQDIELIKKESLEWWIRIYKDDNLVDLSFKRASETLK